MSSIPDRSSPRKIELAYEDPEPYLDELVELYKKAYIGLADYAYEKRQAIRQYIKWLRYDGKNRLLLAKDGSKITGFTAVEYHQHRHRDYCVGTVHEFVVDPDYQAFGVGRRLFEDACRLLEGNGCEHLKLVVGKGNHRARNFYERQGFFAVGSLYGWVRMEKYVGERPSSVVGIKRQRPRTRQKAQREIAGLV